MCIVISDKLKFGNPRANKMIDDSYLSYRHSSATCGFWNLHSELHASCIFAHLTSLTNLIIVNCTAHLSYNVKRIKCTILSDCKI